MADRPTSTSAADSSSNAPKDSASNASSSSSSSNHDSNSDPDSPDADKPPERQQHRLEGENLPLLGDALRRSSSADDNKKDKTPRRRRAPLMLSLRERMKWGLLWGLNLAQQDFEKYQLYFLLTACATPACDYLHQYSLWIFVASFIAIPVNTFSAWLTDATSRRQHIVMLGAVLLQTLGLAGMVTTASYGVGWAAQVFYQCRQAALQQSLTSVWKILKVRLDVVSAKERLARAATAMPGEKFREEEFERAHADAENTVISSVGNFGDVASELTEIVTLCSIALLCRVCSLGTVRYVMSGISLALNCAVLCICATVRTRDLTLPSAAILAAATFEDAQGAADGGRLKSAATPPQARCTHLKCLQSARTVLCWIWVRLSYMFRNPVVINPIMHSLTILLLFNIMTYPITVLISGAGDDAGGGSGSEAKASPHDFCGHSLESLLQQGAITNCVYLCCSFAYMVFLVRCPPKLYYTFVLPGLSLLAGACLLVILKLRGTLEKQVLQVVVSIAQVLPYYCNAFDYYVFSTAIKQEYFGFVYAIYGFGVQGISIVSSGVLYLSVAVQILVLVCLALLCVVTVHGLLMRPLFLSPTWATTH